MNGTIFNPLKIFVIYTYVCVCVCVCVCACINAYFKRLHFQADKKLTRFRSQLEVSCVSNHTNELWYEETVCGWHSINLSIYLSIYLSISLCIYIYIYMCVCVYVCVCLKYEECVEIEHVETVKDYIIRELPKGIFFCRNNHIIIIILRW